MGLDNCTQVALSYTDHYLLTQRGYLKGMSGDSLIHLRTMITKPEKKKKKKKKTLDTLKILLMQEDANPGSPRKYNLRKN